MSKKGREIVERHSIFVDIFLVFFVVFFGFLSRFLQQREQSP